MNFILFFIIGSALLLSAYFLAERYLRKKPALFFPNNALLKEVPQKKWKSWLNKSTDFLRLLSLMLLLSMLIFPTITYSENTTVKKGIDLMFIFDVSLSMNAEDLPPNRLEAAKTVTQKFLENLKNAGENDRLGIVVFAGEAFTEVPLSSDYQVLQYFLEHISVRSVDQTQAQFEGTAIGNALEKALLKLEANEDRSKVIILITDGEYNKGVHPLLPAQKAQEQGVLIHTIGIGKNEPVPIPIGENFGQTIYARNLDGSLKTSVLDEEMLKQIAALTGGQYFHAESAAGLLQSYEQINQLKKVDFENKEIKYSFSPDSPLALTFLTLLLLEIIIRFFIVKNNP